MWNIEVETPGLDIAVADINATTKQAEKALNTTLGKMAGWLRTRAMRGLSKELDVQQKILRRRLKTFRIRKAPGGGAVTVWFGLNEIALIYLGAKETSSGVTAGRHNRPGAFIAQTKGKGRLQVFKRRGKARLPLDKQALSIQDKAQTYIEDNLIGTDEFDDQFFKTFLHELKWQTTRST